MPGSGIEAVKKIRDAVPETKIVILAASDRDDELFAALRAGADGYLLKTIPGERLAHALHGVLNGEAALPRTLTARLIREFGNQRRPRLVPAAGPGEGVKLTAREFEVLAQLRAGKSTAEVAAQLGISEVTVRRHASTAAQKLGVPDRKSAVALLEQELDW
jgi:DNA-binding NarL/FixJ family response regulator